MTIRENLEQWESEYLSPYATQSALSRGRDRQEEQCDIRPVFRETGTGYCIQNRSGALRTKRRFFCRRRATTIGQGLPIRWKYHRMQGQLQGHCS